MQGWARAAQNLHDEQGKVGGPGARAVVAWIGYETPTEATVTQGDHARAGAARLIAELERFNATRAGRDVELHVVAHSYGLTTAANALATADLRVESVTFLGSAGIEQDIATADQVHAGRVYAGQAPDVAMWESGDPWAHLGRLGSGRKNPMDGDFGRPCSTWMATPASGWSPQPCRPAPSLWCRDRRRLPRPENRIPPQHRICLDRAR